MSRCVAMTVDTAMVLAAGLGTRMRPLTDDKPKPMVVLAGRTLLDWALDRLAAAGVKRTVVNTHYFAETIHRHLAARDGIVVSHEAERLETGGRDLVVILNFANADMVGHTGVFDATVRACAVVDRCVGRIADTVLGMGGSLVVTADHGNAEQMIDPATGGPHTAHTLNPVPAIIARTQLRGRRLPPRAGGTLADIGPTMLAMLGLEQPVEMTGRPLLAEAPL